MYFYSTGGHVGIFCSRVYTITCLQYPNIKQTSEYIIATYNAKLCYSIEKSLFADIETHKKVII